MKLFRFAGLLVIAAALLTGSAKTAKASGPYYCYKWCSGILYGGPCTAGLAQCCNFNKRTCPSGTVYEGGDCENEDHTESCPS